MHASKPDGRCPVCGKDYEERIIVARGDDWRDIHGGRPAAYFREYDRRCAAPEDVEDDHPLAPGELAVYFHGSESPPPGLI